MSTNQSVLIIESGRAECHYWRDLWRYRELFLLIPLLLAELLNHTGKKVSQLVDEPIKAYPYSGQINYHMHNVAQTIERILHHIQEQKPIIDGTDGVNAEFPQWSFNLRDSNTELLSRLNMETRGSLPAVLQPVREFETLNMCAV